MVKVKDILREIEHYAPLPLQEGFDNAGVQVGDVNQHATGVLLCLDVTEEVLDEAIEMGCIKSFFIDRKRIIPQSKDSPRDRKSKIT